MDRTGAIFISHSSHDKEEVNKLSIALVGTFQGYIRTFNTSSGFAIPSGVDWRSNILDAIKHAPLVILWGTTSSVDSREVAFEIGAAFAFDTPIISCAVDVPPKGLPWGLAVNQALSMDLAISWEQLPKDIANRIQYSSVLDLEPMREFGRQYVAKPESVQVKVSGLTVDFKNISQNVITIVNVVDSQGVKSDWFAALQNLTLLPGQSTTILRGYEAPRTILLDWKDPVDRSFRIEIKLAGGAL